MYKIVATNEHGKDEAEVEVVVLGAPGRYIFPPLQSIFMFRFNYILGLYIVNVIFLFRPKGPLKVTDVTKSSAKVKWEKPEGKASTVNIFLCV